MPEGVQARLNRGGYVFPVFGPVTFGHSFGSYRADVAGNWHHGEDIVATFGAPVLAVADGTVFSVGWNDIGGWRLWLLSGNPALTGALRLKASRRIPVSNGGIDCRWLLYEIR